MASHKKQQLRKKKLRERARKQRAPLPGLPSDVVIALPPGERKMSAMLLELLRPSLDPPPDERGMHVLLKLGIIAWNIAAAPAAERETILQSAAAKMAPELRDDFLAAVNDLIARKQALFPDIQRTILDYELTWTPQGPHLSVVAALAG